MKDVLGNKLSIGDKVVATVSQYEELAVYYVHSFTPKKVRLSKAVDSGVATVKFSNQVCKIL